MLLVLLSKFTTYLFVGYLLAMQTGNINCMDPYQESRCLNCIRNVSTLLNIDVSKRCEDYYCGPFQISYTYWAEAGKPGNNQGARDYEKCAKNKECAEQTVKAFFRKFKKDCNNDGLVDCLDMAALHKGGLASCSSDWFYKSRYWLAFNKTICATSREDRIDATKLDSIETLRDPIKVMKNQSLTNDCLDCICEAVSGCNTSVNNCGSGTVCGPFAISQAYWKDGRKPGASWTACTRTKECSSVTIKNYMEKYKKDCNGDGYITCEDYAAIHRRGPRACSNKDLYKDHYWNKFLLCRSNRKPPKDVNLVKVDEASEDIAQSLALASANDPMNSLQPTNTHGLPLGRPNIATSSSTNEFQLNSASKTDSVSTITYEMTSLTASTKQDNIPTKQSSDSSSIASLAVSNEHRTLIPQNSPFESKENNSDLPRVTKPDNILTYRPIETTRVTPKYDRVSQLPKLGEFPSTLAQNSVIRSQDQDSTISGQHSSAPPVELTTKLPQKELQAPIIKYSTTVVSPVNQISSSAQTVSIPKAYTESSPQQMLNLTPQEHSSSPVLINDDTEYSNSEFSFPGNNNNADRTTSFDKVVIGIVGSPDFSKSYPPLPDLSVSGKHNEPPSISESDLQPSGKSHQTVNTNHSKGQVINPKTLIKLQGTDQSNMALNDPTLHANDKQNERNLDTSQATSLFGLDSMNVTSLIESNKIASECLECICDASSNCDTTVQCISKQREKNRCGLYMISWNQYQDSDISLASSISTGSPEEINDEKLYYECTTDRVCAEKLIHLYIEKYQKDCNNDGKIDCYDIAAIHRVGPDNCNSTKFLSSQYWKDFNICYATDRLATTMPSSTIS